MDVALIVRLQKEHEKKTCFVPGTTMVLQLKQAGKLTEKPMLPVAYE